MKLNEPISINLFPSNQHLYLLNNPIPILTFQQFKDFIDYTKPLSNGNGWWCHLKLLDLNQTLKEYQTQLQTQLQKQFHPDIDINTIKLHWIDYLDNNNNICSHIINPTILMDSTLWLKGICKNNNTNTFKLYFILE